MSSGMGVRGTMGRCYGFFQDFLACEANTRKMLQQIDLTQGDGGAVTQMKSCFDEREDYFECLHSRKEFARIKTVLDEKKRQNID